MPEDETPFPWSLNPGDYLERRATWLLILCCSGAMLALLLLLIVTMRNRVAIAIELIEEGSVVSISTHCVYSIDNIYSIYCIYVDVYLLHAIHRSVACGHMLSTLFFPPVPFLLQVHSRNALD